MGKNQRTVWVILAAGITCLAADADEPRAAKELQNLWRNLGTDDPAKTQQAITALVAKADQVIPFFQKQLRPVPRPEPSRLARLIADLDSKEYKVRQRATQDLERLGEPAEAALRQALAARPSPEARRRIERILETHKRERLYPTPEQQRLSRAVEVLEQVGSPAARRLLETLSKGAPKAALTLDAQGALHRLAERAAGPP